MKWRFPRELWTDPWPQLAELEGAAPADMWTLVGGLMVQLHAIRRHVESIRPTAGMDALLHMEMGATSKPQVAVLLSHLGYELQEQVLPGLQELH